MDEELRKKAKKKVDAKMSFYTTLIVFSFTVVILVILTFALPKVAFWLLLPIPALVMVLGVLYLNAFGYNLNKSYTADWKEEEIQKEMLRLKMQDQPEKQQEYPAATESLELKELERLEEKEGWEEDLV
jgi:glucan phosphoethanolaminetransferase (alkaline phosphatase superfamily)